MISPKGILNLSDIKFKKKKDKSGGNGEKEEKKLTSLEGKVSVMVLILPSMYMAAKTQKEKLPM